MRYSRFFVSLILIFSILLAASVVSLLPICAYNEYNYEEAGYDFLINQYELKNIEYENIKK